MCSSDLLAISPLIYDKLNYRPMEDLAYVGQYGRVPNVLLVNPQLPAKDVKDLVAHVRANPGKLNYASNGYGTSPQMSMELFKAMTGTFIVHIPFRGGAPALASVLANETQLFFENMPPVLPQIRAGKVRALAVTSLARSPALPDMPTLDESGLKGYEVTSWFGLNAPAATPREVLAKINAAIVRALSSAEMRELWARQGMEVALTTPEQTNARLRADYERYGKLIRDAGVRLE